MNKKNVGLLIITLFISVNSLAGSTANGSRCNLDSDCGSNKCWPGPDYNGKYCINAAKNCAWPNKDGYFYGKTKGGKVCLAPDQGRAYFCSTKKSDC